MTYFKSNPIPASDYNALAGLTASPGSAGSVAAVAGYIWGVGYGDRGYGETAPPLVSKNKNDVMMASDWLNLRAVINNLATWQGVAPSMLPSTSEFGGVAKVEASGTIANNYRIISFGSSASTGLSAGVFDGGGTLIGAPSRSYMLSVFSRSTGALVSHKAYDVYGSTAAAGTLSTDLNALGNDSIVAVWTFDEPQNDRTAGLLTALYRCGATAGVVGSSSFQYRSAYVLIGIPGCGTGNGFEAYAGNIDRSTTALLDINFTIKNGQFWITGQGTNYANSSILTTTSSYVTDVAPFNTYSKYDFSDILALVDSNRFHYHPANMTLTTSAATTVRATTWGGGSTGITCEFSVTFTGEDAARYFFNTGGELRVTLNHTDTSTARNSSWNTVINNLTIAFRANGTARIAGSYGLPTGAGYYGLTTTYQAILDGTNTGISPYGVNDFYIDAKAVSITGLNGAKGSQLYFRVRLIDEQTNAFSDIVAAGTAANLSHLRATASPLTAKAAPTCSVVTAF